MIAAYKKNKDVILKEKHRRELSPREIRLKVEACGICGTDIFGEDKEFSPFGHEVATVENADRILVMEQGRFVEQGSHLELMSKNGCYTALAKEQNRLERIYDLEGS